MTKDRLLRVKELFMRYLLLLSVLMLGCAGKEASKVSGGSANTSAAKADDKEETYKASVIAFIEEAKSILKAIDQSHDKAAFDKRYKSLEEQLAKIPSPPSGFVPGESWAKSNKTMLTNLAIVGTLLKNESDRNQLGQFIGSLNILLDHYKTKVQSSQSHDVAVLAQ